MCNTCMFTSKYLIAKNAPEHPFDGAIPYASVVRASPL